MGDEPAAEGPGAGATSAPLSDRLAEALDDEELTLGRLTDVLDEGSIALVLLVLLAPSALPIPTGGVTNVLELVALLSAVQLALGRQELWLPSRFARHRFGPTFKEKAAPKFVGFVRWFERFTRPRLAGTLDTRAFRMFLGLVLVVFVLGALLAPPFSGLDTLPSLGVVVVSIGMLVRDALVVLFGILVGAIGLGLVVVLGSLAWSFVA